MKKEIKKFLEFNGKVIYFVAVDGQYWIALKPICEALNVNWNRQFQNLKEDEILRAVFAKQQMQAPDNQIRNYVALPEFFVYGWLFQMKSSSPDLQQYKWECYRVLYEHFHGLIGGRKNLLREKAKAQIEMDAVYNSLPVDQALKLQKAEKQINQINNRLRKLDIETLQEERNLFSTT